MGKFDWTVGAPLLSRTNRHFPPAPVLCRTAKNHSGFSPEHEILVSQDPQLSSASVNVEKYEGVSSLGNFT
jgi:hypothetical protein